MQYVISYTTMAVLPNFDIMILLLVRKEGIVDEECKEGEEGMPSLWGRLCNFLYSVPFERPLDIECHACRLLRYETVFGSKKLRQKCMQENTSCKQEVNKVTAWQNLVGARLLFFGQKLFCCSGLKGSKENAECIPWHAF
jgi:hypothetical protein